MFKPVLPVLYDKVAHLCWEYEHLQVVHQHNGIYHVDQDLRDMSDKNEKESTNGSYKFEVSDYLHVISSNTIYDFAMALTVKKNFPLSSIYFPIAHRETDYPPPKA